MHRETLSIVLRRCAGWSSVSDPDIGAVSPVGDVCGLGLLLHGSVQLNIYGGVWGCWSLLVTGLGELGVWHVVSRKVDVGDRS